MPLRFPSRDFSTLNGYAGNVLDRRAEKRDPAMLAAALADERARIILMNELDVLIDPARGTLGFAPAVAEGFGLERDGLILLGWDGTERPWFAAPLGGEAMTAAAGGGLEIIQLRPLVMDERLPREEIGAAAQARSLLAWNRSHFYCARCGTRTDGALAGYRRDCPSCGAQHFPRTDPVVIMLVVDGDRVLLGRSHRFADGMYSCLAGFMEPGETIEDAVRREVREEAGIIVGPVAYHSSQPWPFVANLMIGCFGRATSTDIVLDAEELADCRWFSRQDVALMAAGQHPDGYYVPISTAIARKLIEHWLAEPE